MNLKNYACEGQLRLFDILEPEKEEEFVCEGCIFDTKNKCCGYPITEDDYCVLGNKKITNKVIKQLIDDLENIYPGKIDGIEYQVWEHVPNLGKRLWLNIEAVGEEWDLTGIINKYREASLEVSVSAVPHFVGGKADVEGNSLYISTMWTTKGHKEVLEYDFITKAAELNVCKFSGHTCNKEELWKVAESLDDPFCPHVCCRFCNTKHCGARCNGSEEPQKEAEPKCSKAKECEAYPRGCGGSIEPCRFGGPFKWSEQPQEVDIRGICDDGYCPKCNCALDDLVERCPECNTLLDWKRWRKLNAE